MKTIIAGSRTAVYFYVDEAMRLCPFTSDITEVVSGGNKVVKDGLAYGADYHGEQWAKLHRTPIKQFLAAWDDLMAPGAIIRYRKGAPYNAAAGPQRNQQMADYADALILVWDGKSKGSADMLEKARVKGLRLFVFDYVHGLSY